GATVHAEALEILEQLPLELIMRRWTQRWADLPVWVVEWRPHDARPRLLARPGRLRFRAAARENWVIVEHDDPDHDRGYTTRTDRALAGEPEVVDHNLLRATWRNDSERRHAAARGGRDRPPGNRRAA